MTEPNFILNARCDDQIGVVAAIATVLAGSKAFITESSHFGDPETGLFFMRTAFRATDGLCLTQEDFAAALQPVVRRFGMTISITPAERRTRVMVAVSKHGHCLNHLLHQWHSGELPIDIVGVLSNHADFQRLVEWYGLPFHHLPIGEGGKTLQEARMLDCIAASKAELTVLARYMQVLSDDACRQLQGRCINIHHSFLPSFKGAKPYHQAHHRGVKLVGATAHYVTADLDEGPIIEQETVRVSHASSPETFVRMGKDVESAVLSRAVRWHAERRVLLDGQRTVVFA